MYQPPSDRPKFPPVETRIHERKARNGGTYFMWGAVRLRDGATLVAASCWTRGAAQAEAGIWQDEYQKSGDREAALVRVMAARDVSARERAGAEG